MSERNRLTIAILVLSTIQGLTLEEQVEVLFATILEMADQRNLDH